MITVARWLGWTTAVGWVLAAFGGAGVLSSRSSHLLVGLTVVLLTLFVHVQTYFWFVGSVVRARASGPHVAGSVGARAVARLIELKASQLAPTIAVVTVLIAGPIIGLIQAGGSLPAWCHGVFMIAVGVGQFGFAARSLFRLQIGEGLLDVCVDRDV